MGALPEWYVLLRAARYLQVAPWDLAARPTTWMDWALMAESAENEARAVEAKARGKRK